MSTLTVHHLWKDNMAREKIGHLPSYAETKKMKSLTLHTHDCPRASLRECSSSSFSSSSSSSSSCSSSSCSAVLLWPKSRKWVLHWNSSMKPGALGSDIVADWLKAWHVLQRVWVWVSAKIVLNLWVWLVGQRSSMWLRTGERWLK